MKISHPKIVIVGRPNVGKSSLFNRIVGSRKAIVESSCGTTRDRLYADVRWKGKSFTIVDTGGFEPARPGELPRLVLGQLKTAIDEADIIFFVTDSVAGVTPQDYEFVSILRKSSKKIFLVVNKADDKARSERSVEFFELGLGEVYAVSAVNGTGIERLMNDAARCAGKPSESTQVESVSVAIVGRPNVGKSSYLNTILKEERVIVHPTAGTTRDSVDTDFAYMERDYVLIDTAGIRHNAKLEEAADFYGSVRSKEAIRRSHVAVVLIDGYDGMREDDERIIEFVINEGKGLVIGVNKWDLVKNAEMSKYSDMLKKKLPGIKNYPLLFISCKSGRNVTSSLDVIWGVYERSRAMLGPAELKETLKSLNGTQELTSKRMRFTYLAQEKAAPPSFVIGVKGPRMPKENLKRYVENFIRGSRDYSGVPIRIRYNS